MHRHFGAPVKGVLLRAGTEQSRGEFVIARHGLEGGGIYAISRAIREGAELTLDLLPDWTEDAVAKRLATGRGKTTLTNHLRKSLRLDPPQIALALEFGRPLKDGVALAPTLKSLAIPITGPYALDTAISTAGGLRWQSLDAGLMLRAMPGVFAAGEMLDWEAPTGGYLMTACLATGRWAGRAAARYVKM